MWAQAWTQIDGQVAHALRSTLASVFSLFFYLLLHYLSMCNWPEISRPASALGGGTRILHVWHPSKKHSHHYDADRGADSERRFAPCNTWPKENGTHRERGVSQGFLKLQFCLGPKESKHKINHSVICGIFKEPHIWKHGRPPQNLGWPL